MENVDVEKLVKDNQNNMATTTQLRLLLSNAVVIKNKVEIENKDILSEKLQGEVKYLLIKHIYQCGRDKKVKEFNERFKIEEKIKKIGDSSKKFNEFYRYLEEIVAYVKYHVDKQDQEL